MPTLRQNIVTGDWVVIAPERARRPHDFKTVQQEAFKIESDCVFCVDSEAYKTRIIEFDNQSCFLIPNKYPVFTDKHDQQNHRRKIEKESIGGHDVVVIKDQDLDIYTFQELIWQDFFTILRERTRWYFEKAPHWTVLPIYNHGIKSGATIRHPHGQILASHHTPPIINKELAGAKKFFDEHSQCVFCSMIGDDREESLIIDDDLGFSAISPYAARFPFEVWIIPNQHLSYFDHATDQDLSRLSNFIKNIFDRYKNVLKAPDLNFYIHTSPHLVAHDAFFHWHLEISPRLDYWGSYEYGSGTIINTMSPEKAAKYLRRNGA